MWRNRLREIVTNPVPKSEDKGGEDYEALFKEILPKQLWNFAASDTTDSYELPFVYLENVRVCCVCSCLSCLRWCGTWSIPQADTSSRCFVV